MKHVNTTYWREFRVGDLFPIINKPKVYHTREVVEDSLGIPYVVRSKFNNGIKCRIKPEGLEYSPGGVISFGAENASFFYQKEQWCGGRDIYYIDTQNIHPYACLFLTACLNQITDKYSYNFGLFPDLLRNEKIKLPIKDGSPDWQYMEEYMRHIEERTKLAISAFASSKFTPSKIDTIYWKEFKIDDLFEIPKCSKKVWKINADEDGTIPIYSSESVNNGIVGYCNLEPFYIVNNEHPVYLIFGDHTRAFHIANSSFCVADNVKVLRPKHKQMSILVLCFISTIWKAKIPNLGYSRHWMVAKDIKIPLPSTLSGEPDWRYIEMYMRGVEAVTKEKISLLTKKRQEPLQQTNITNYGTVNIYEK